MMTAGARQQRRRARHDSGGRRAHDCDGAVRDGHGKRALLLFSSSPSPSHGLAGGWASQIRCCGAWCGGRSSAAVMLDRRWGSHICSVGDGDDDLLPLSC
uniref:Uncharacterized protein n=1 Tax=Oryza meridionalis TaxID=40149 RepID=A0A0E0E7Z9_9ORYZ